MLQSGNLIPRGLQAAALVLLTSAPASAVTPPQAEGMAFYVSSLPFILAALALILPRFTPGRAAMVLLLAVPGFFMVGFIAWGFFLLPCLLILEGQKNHKRMRLAARHAANPEKHRPPRVAPVPWKRFAGGALLLVPCAIMWGLTVWSAAYDVIAYRHERAVERVRTSAESICRYRQAHRSFPPPAEARRLVASDLPITYETSPDRSSFRLTYTGNAFTQNPWYTLDKGLPEYRSDGGLNPGVRKPFLAALRERAGAPRAR